ncbi:MAG: hypothetical protein AVDCRST_MAG69-2779, partial [uncultured Solirubrobacteraceae bacterium]
GQNLHGCPGPQPVRASRGRRAARLDGLPARRLQRHPGAHRSRRRPRGRGSRRDSRARVVGRARGGGTNGHPHMPLRSRVHQASSRVGPARRPQPPRPVHL